MPFLFLLLAVLGSRFSDVAQDARGHVGVMAVVLETGQQASLDPDGRYPMQSSYKFPIGMAVLHAVDEGRLSLDAEVEVRESDLMPPDVYSPLRDEHPRGCRTTVRDLLRRMVSLSDNTASDMLLGLVGGPGAVTDYVRGLGVEGMVVADPERVIQSDVQVQYRNWASPRGFVQLLRALHEGRGLSADSRALLLQFMTDTPTGPKRLKGLLPPGTVVAHKTGTARTHDGLAPATNDVGLVTLPDGRHMAIAVLVKDSRADEATRDAVIARVARAAWDTFTR